MSRTLIVSTLLALAFLAGCSSTTNPSAEGPVTGRTLPNWVLVVPVEESGRSVFVGGCTMALTAAEGIQAARDDASLQITSAARSGFIDVFALSPQESGVTTSSIDRLDFREMGLALYAEAMVRSSSLDRVHLRSCSTGQTWDLPHEPDDGEVDGEVCSVFVRVSCDTDGWERNLFETLLEMRRSFGASRRDNLADLADWMAARLPELLGGAPRSDVGAGARIR